MAGERLGRLMSSLEQYNAEPFDLEGIAKIKTYDNAFPTAMSIMSMPLKASAYWNMARMGFYGGKSLGFLSSIRRPFSANRLKWRYEATHVRGLIGDVIKGPSDTSVFSIRKHLRGIA